MIDDLILTRLRHASEDPSSDWWYRAQSLGDLRVLLADRDRLVALLREVRDDLADVRLEIAANRAYDQHYWEVGWRDGWAAGERWVLDHWREYVRVLAARWRRSVRDYLRWVVGR